MVNWLNSSETLSCFLRTLIYDIIRDDRWKLGWKFSKTSSGPQSKPINWSLYWLASTLVTTNTLLKSLLSLLPTNNAHPPFLPRCPQNTIYRIWSLTFEFLRKRQINQRLNGFLAYVRGSNCLRRLNRLEFSLSCKNVRSYHSPLFISDQSRTWHRLTFPLPRPVLTRGTLLYISREETWALAFVLLAEKKKIHRCSRLFLICTWRHGDHVDVQNNSGKSLLRIWFGYYAKLERHFAIVCTATWPSHHVHV